MKKFNKEIENLAKSFNKPPIYDGVVNEKEYLKSETKILWVLKEANSTDEESYDLREAIYNLKTEDGIRKRWGNTFRNIIYVTEGILNQTNWDDIPFPRNQPEMVNVLKQIAYINIKKIGGGSQSVESELQEHFEKSKPLLMSQIEEFNPDVVIFGNTYRFFENELGLNRMNSFGTCHATAKNRTIYINAYHPNARINGKDYFEDIIKAYKTFKKQIYTLSKGKSYANDVEIIKEKTNALLIIIREIQSALLDDLEYEKLANYKDIEKRLEKIVNDIEKN